MNFKKIVLSLSVTGLLFGSILPSIGQSSDNDSPTHLIPIIDFILSSDTLCSEPSSLSIANVTANGNEGDNVAARANDGIIGTRWSSDAANPNVLPAGVGIITFELASTSTVTDLSIAWFRSDERTTAFSVERSIDNVNWVEVVSPTRTSISPESEFQTNDIDDAQANYIRIIGTGNDNNAFTSISEVVINGCPNRSSPSSSSSSSSSSSNSSTSSTGGPDPVFGLDPDLEPWENFDLTDWALDTPADFATRTDTSRPFSPDNGSLVPDGLADRTMDFDFAAGTLVPGSEPFFYTGPDGGMVFKSTQGGFRTSPGTSFTRSELREMLRRGDRSINTSGVNENNWVLGYQPPDNQLQLRSGANNIGGRNGRLAVTLRVNQVTSTGDAGQVGRVIIGQIHAEDDEPIRLYYRKLPFNELGGIYFAHEKHASLGPSSDILINMIGTTTSRSAPNPINGIALGELFSYEIVNEGANLIVTIRRGDLDSEIIQSNVLNNDADDPDNFLANSNPNSISNPFGLDMSDSGYDQANEWMYFRAGAYSQNNTADEDDFDMVTIYRIENSHDE